MALSRKIDLPSTQEMMDSVESFYAELEASGKPKRLAHNMATTQVKLRLEACRCRVSCADIESWAM